MPRTIAEIRQANGGLDTLTDEDILQAEYGRYKAYYPSIDDFASDVGYAGAGRGKWGSRMSSSIDQYQAGLYGLGEAVSGAAGLTGAEDYFARGREQNEAAAEYASQRAREQGAIESYKDIGGVGDFFDYAGGLGVQSLPYLGEAFTGGIAGRALLTGARVGLSRGAASTVGAVGAGYPSSVSDILQSQRDQTDETDLLSAGALGVPYSALNALGIEGAVARGTMTRAGIKALDEMTGLGGAAARTAATVAKAAPIEAASETGQEIINQFGRMAVDPTTGLITPEAVERYKESAVGGLVLGGTFAGAAGGWRRTQDGGTDLTAPEDTVIGLQDTGTLGESLTDTTPAQLLSRQPTGMTGSENQLPLGKTLTSSYEGKTAEEILAELEAPADTTNAEDKPTVQILSPGRQALLDKGINPYNRGALQKATPILENAAASGLSEDALAPVYTLLQNARYKDADTLLGKLYATEQLEQRAANVGDTTGAVSEPAGGVGGGSVDLAGGVAPTGSVLTSERGLPTSGDTAGTLPADGQTISVPVADAQPAADVVTDAEPVSSATAVVRNLTKEIYPEEADAILESLDTDLSKTELANKYGLDRRKLNDAINAFPAQLQALVEAKNFSPEQKAALVASMPARVVEAAPEADAQVSVLDQNELLSGEGMSAVGSAGSGSAKVSAKSSRKPRTEKQQQVIDDLRTQLDELEVSSEEVGVTPEREAAIATLSQKIQSLEAASTPASEIVDVTVDRVMKLDEQISRLQASIDAAVAAGNAVVTTSTEAKSVAAAKAELAKLREAIAKEIAETKAVASKLGMRSADKPAETKATPTQTEARQRWRDAKQDLTKLSVEDLKVLLPYVRDTLKNTKLASSISAEISSRGATDAVQKPSAAQVPVRERAAGSQEVGEGDTQGRQVAAEGQAQTQKVTAEPTAQAAWDAAVADFPDAPKFADLTKEQQTTFTEFGPENWTPADVTQELAKIQRQITGKITNKSKSGDRVTVGEDKDAFTGVVSSRAEIEQNPAAKRALDSYVNNGLGDYVDSVDLWVLADSDSDFDAAVLVHNGQRTLAIRVDIFNTDPDLTFTSIHHEMGHILDGVLEGEFKFSQDTELNSVVKDGRVIGYGPVIREVLAYYAANKNKTGLGQFFRYPLKFKAGGAPTSARLREEVFAQLWATFNLPKGNKALKEEMPIAYAYMEMVYEAAYQAKNKPTSAAQGAAVPQATAREKAAEKVSGTTVDLRASRVSKNIRFSDRIIAALPAVLRAPVRASVDFISDIGGNILDRVVFTSDLVDMAVKAGLPSARGFLDVMSKSRSFASEMERDIEKIADGYATIEEKDKGSGPRSANQFLFESTRMGKWGYGKNADPEMAAWFNNELGPKSQAFIKSVFAHGDAMLSKKKQIVMSATTSEFDAMIAEAKASGDLEKVASLKKDKANSLTKFQTLFKLREGKPYAPIKRTGSHVVFAKSANYIAAVQAKDSKRKRELEQNGDDYQVTFVDSKYEARRLAQELEASGLYGEVNFSERAEAIDNMFSGEALLPALTKLRTKVNDAEGGPKAQMREIINQLYLEALAEGSARKSEMRRRGISGQVDMLNSFTMQGRADAQFLASVQYGPKVQEQLRNIQKESKTGDTARKSEIKNELLTRYLDSLEYKPQPWIQALTGLSSKYFLATSPGYYLQNLTQPFMMSLPAMAGAHDYVKAGKELFKAYTELGPIMKATNLFDQQFDFDKVPDDVKAAIKQLVAEGKIDIGLATEISEYKVDADSKLTNTAAKINKGMRLAVQKAEAINRLSTAMAAYRLEIAAGKSQQVATEYAGRILTETHGDYTSFNAPRAFNNNFGKIALQFRKFQLIQLSFFAKLFRDAFTNPKERRAAMKTLGYTLGHTAVFAGVMGMPGYAAISAMLALFGDEDEPYDLTQELREMLGPDLATLVLRGAPTLADIDLSGKIGYGNMLSVMPFSNADLNTAAGRAEALGTMVGGASLGMATRVVDGLGLMINGDWYKGIERTMPKGISDMMKSGRTATQGMTRRNGDVILPAEEVNSLGTVFSAIGLPSAKQAVIYENRTRADELKKNFTERTTRIKNQYIKAAKAKDQAGMKEAREAWVKLQDAKRRNGVKVTPLSSLLKAPMEQAKRERNTIGGIQFTRSTAAMARQIAQEGEE